MKKILTLAAIAAFFMPAIAQAADEVQVWEFGQQILKTQGNDVSDAGYGQIVTTQVLDIGTLSAQFNSATRSVVVCSKDTGFWLIFGSWSASAAADTNGNLWIAANTCSPDQPVNQTHPSNSSIQYVDTAADG